MTIALIVVGGYLVGYVIGAAAFLYVFHRFTK